MSRRCRGVRLAGLLVGAALAGGSGCHSASVRGGPRTQPHDQPAPTAGAYQAPGGSNTAAEPQYVVEAPDILSIDAQRLTPLPSYRIEPLDALYLSAPGTPEADPIRGVYPVDADGTINLGPNYGGALPVAGRTVPEVRAALARRLADYLGEPTAAVSLAECHGVQAVRGEHLVRPDGTVSLGVYGSVRVAGLTLPQVRAAVETQLAESLDRPEVSVRVSAYNSKFYDVIAGFAGPGERSVRLPFTGAETVTDAVSQAGRMSPSSAVLVWIARQAPSGSGERVLPVDWDGIARRGDSRTNYHIAPGDQVFVADRPLPRIGAAMARVFFPVEWTFWMAAREFEGEGDFDGGNTTDGDAVR